MTLRGVGGTGELPVWEDSELFSPGPGDLPLSTRQVQRTGGALAAGKQRLGMRHLALGTALSSGLSQQAAEWSGSSRQGPRPGWLLGKQTSAPGGPWTHLSSDCREPQCHRCSASQIDETINLAPRAQEDEI